MPSLDLDWVRSQFPALAETVNGQPAIFFDGPGGSQVPQRVIDAVSRYYIHANSNSHGAFVTSERTDHVIQAARQGMADLLNCAPSEIAFGPNMTTLTFALSRAIGRTLQPGDEILLTRLDHDANFSPWKALEERGVLIRVADVDIEDCTLDMADLASKITPKTKLVAVGYASNAVGSINDVAAITKLAHAQGALVFIDAVHYAPHALIDVQALDCDFLACSPYKFFGPHMGALYGKAEHLQRFQPYKVRPASDVAPDRWETGTKNHEGLAGVAAAIDYLAELGARVSDTAPANQREALSAAFRAIHDYERELITQLIVGLLAIPGLTFYGISDSARFDQRTPTVAIRIDGFTPAQLAKALGERGIFTWDGNYYALNLTERLGVEQDGGMLRIGLIHYNTASEVETFLTALRSITVA